MKVIIYSLIGFLGSKITGLVSPFFIENAFVEKMSDLLFNCLKICILILIWYFEVYYKNSVKMDPFEFTQKFLECTIEFLNEQVFFKDFYM